MPPLGGPHPYIAVEKSEWWIYEVVKKVAVLIQYQCVTDGQTDGHVLHCPRCTYLSHDYYVVWLVKDFEGHTGKWISKWAVEMYECEWLGCVMFVPRLSDLICSFKSIYIASRLYSCFVASCNEARIKSIVNWRCTWACFKKYEEDWVMGRRCVDYEVEGT